MSIATYNTTYCMYCCCKSVQTRNTCFLFLFTCALLSFVLFVCAQTPSRIPTPHVSSALGKHCSRSFSDVINKIFAHTILHSKKQQMQHGLGFINYTSGGGGGTDVVVYMYFQRDYGSHMLLSSP